MGDYTDYTLVSAELNGVTIGSTTVPSSTTVENWISEVESEINLRTGKIWTSSVVTDQILDYDGSGYIKLPVNPVLAVSTLSYEEKGLGASSESWVSLTEGRTNDYIFYVADGEIELTGKGDVPGRGKQNIKITYTKGYADVPSYIQRLATLMAARRFIQSVVQGTAKDEGGSITVGNISITDPSNFSAGQVRDMDKEIEEIFATRIGSSRVFFGKRTYDLRN